MSPVAKMKRAIAAICLIATFALAGCKSATKVEPQTAAAPAPVYFKVDSATAGVIQGKISFTGKRPTRKPIDMSEEPACVEAHHGKAYDESLVVNPNGTLANVFVYVKGGLEGKTFEIPTTPVVIDQQGCWFHPRVLGIQMGQVLSVIELRPGDSQYSPMAEINREWNHSQGAGRPAPGEQVPQAGNHDRVKCNIHRWMHAFIGVVDNPYFAVTGADGSFEIRNLPPGDYVIEAWHETLGTQEQKITVLPHREN